MTATVSTEPVPFLDGIVYGEGPRWHDGRLWFTDGFANQVCSVDENGVKTVEVEIENASGLGWLSDGTMVVSTLREAKIHHVGANGQLASSSDLSDIAWSTNDLFVAPNDNTYVDIYQRNASSTVGQIGLLETGGALRIVADGLAVPNGMGLLPDGSTFVVSETMGSRILAFTAEPDGSLGAPRVFADLGPARHPDGLCVDIEGAVWVGCFDTGEFLRVLDGGAVTHRVAIETGWAVAPALGGDDMRTLYLMVNDTTFDGMQTGESTGWIMQSRVEVPGAGSP